MLKKVGTVCFDIVHTVLEEPAFTVALLAIVVVPFAGREIYDRLYNYAQATVQVSKVERVCYVTARDGRQPQERLPADACDELRQKIAKGERLENFRIRENTIVSFRYTSPVDGAEHEGQLERDANAKTPGVDEPIQILISRVDPNVVRD